MRLRSKDWAKRVRQESRSRVWVSSTAESRSPPFGDGVTHLLLVLHIHLRHFPPARKAHIPLPDIRGGNGGIAQRNKQPVHGFALACITGIHVTRRHMAPVLRQEFAVTQTNIALLSKALDGVNIAVVDARAFGLPLHFGLAVFRDADAVAFADGELAGAAHLKPVCTLKRQHAARSIASQHRYLASLYGGDHRRIAFLKTPDRLTQAFCAFAHTRNRLMKINDHPRFVIARVRLFSIRPVGGATHCKVRSLPIAPRSLRFPAALP